ncbi:MAG: TonB family protein [Myxococcales bacterium]|nr:TonB family protein [Myxococcales bacterium]
MSAMAVNFKIYQDGVVVRQESIVKDAIKIGRMSSSHLQIDDESVSRMHAVIEVTGMNDAHILDMDSEQGTFLNGERITKSPLNNGDMITLGQVQIEVSFSPAAVASPGVGAALPGLGQGLGMGGMAMGGAGMAHGMMDHAAAPRAAAYVDLNTVEDVTKQSVEVVAMWNHSVLQVFHYSPDTKEAEQYCVGEDFTCQFPLPLEVLNGQSKVSLMTNHPGGGATVTLLPGATGDVTMEDGSRIPLEEIIQSGQVAPAGDIPGGYAFNLPPRGRVKMDVGPWTFLVNAVPSPRKFVAPFVFDWSHQIYNGISAVLHGIFLFIIFFIPPSPEGLSLDQLDENNRFIRAMLAAAEVKQEEAPDLLKKDKKDEKQGGKGKRHKGEEGQMGKRDSRKTDNHYGIKGPKDNPNPRMARDASKEMAKTAGILSYLSASNAPTSPFGADTALGVDPENALGALMGNQVGENFGYGGLGLSGTGRGGGGTGEGTIGLGNLNTIGHGGGGGSGSGYGRGAGGLGGRRGRAPQIRSGAAMVKGSLSKEVIRRIVHRHINEVSFCYERELAKRPDLQGRVSIKFIISGTGAVQMAAVEESTLGNAAVENCIAQAVRRWTFPQPEGGGVVIVTYPFQLTTPGG